MLNATSNRTFIQGLKTGLWAVALASMLIAPLPSLAANENAPAAKADTQIQKSAQDETTQKRKEIVAEAVSAVSETGNALKALDEGTTKDALSALERATGKLELILARDPGLALAPASVRAMTYDVLGSADAVKEATSKAEDLLAKGKIQDARQILKGLGSETVISTANIPLATYPAAIKEAVRLIDQNKTEEAKAILQTALNTLVITEAVIPLPVVRAQEFLKEAETLSEKADRTAEDNQRLTTLLDASRKQIDMAQALGYGTEKDFDTFYKELALIEDKTSAGKSGSGFFESIKTSMTSMFDDSQHEDKPKTSTN
jgi:hypothetical protein